MKKVNFLNNFFSKFFNKKCSHTQYEEIFSTTENKINTKNTNPLEIDDENIQSENNQNFQPQLSKQVEKIKETNNLLEYLLSEIYSRYPEYIKRQNAKVIRETLKKEIKSLRIKVFALYIIFLLTISFDVILRIKPNFLSLIPFNINILYFSSELFLFLLSLLICFKIIKSSFIHLFKNIFTFDTSIIFSVITTFFYGIYSLIVSILAPQIQLSDSFLCIFILNLIFIICNLLTIKKRILNNLNFVTSFKQKYTINTLNLNNIISTNKQNKKQKLTFAYQCKTNFLNNFISSSHEMSTIDLINTKLIPCSIIFSILNGVTSFILTKNLNFTLSALNISSLIFCIPITLSLISNLITSSLCKYGLKNKALIVNGNSIQKLSKVKSLTLTDSDLYPSDNVTLRGIKTFNGQRIDEAILSAAAVICSLNAPISHVFDKIIMGQRTILTKASDVIYKDNKGVVGWVNGQRVLVGNRELLKEYKVGPPSRDYEKKHCLPNCELTYFAIGHDLVAMFIIEYTPSQKIYDVLYSCVKNNIKIFVKTVDSNISLKKIISDFNINQKNVTLLTYKEAQLIDNFCNKSFTKTKALISTLGSNYSLITCVCACKNAKNNIKLISIIQALELLFSIFLVSSLIFSFGLSEIHNIELLIYSLSWFFLTFIASKIKHLK